MKTLRNDTARSAIIDRLKRLKGDETALWGKMSVGQMMSHLVQTGELPFVDSEADRSSFMSRTILKPLVLYVLPMPKEVKVSPTMDQQQKGRPPVDFASDRELAIASIEKLGTLAADHKCLNHPFFGPMSAAEWATIAHKHIDHHLKQFGV
jgi:hypothetical protein